MTLNDQIGLYASAILVMLTLLRIISGITGSRPVKDAVLLSAVFSTVALLGAGVAKFALEIDGFRLLLADYGGAAKTVSLLWQMIWIVCMFYYVGLGVIFRLYVRSTRFKDWGAFGNLRVIPIAKWYRDRGREKKGDKKGYETTSPSNAFDETTISLLKKHLGNAASYRHPLLITGSSPWAIRRKLIKLIVELIMETDEEFNYVCCTISPANIWRFIEKEYPDSELQNKLKRRLVFVDAYTETFGFGDEILTSRVVSMRAEKLIEIVSCNSAAGVHNGTTEAFKILKKSAIEDKRERGACTVIYDTLTALAIPETEEEIAEFIIHISAAEYTYDMLTLFVEADIENRESISVSAIRSCCGSPITLEVEE
ncbi:MAG: hypothetical protein JKX76_03225 [Colwellia sp.]|nr:hypothetical protein [Colwellia sp.]